MLTKEQIEKMTWYELRIELGCGRKGEEHNMLMEEYKKRRLKQMEYEHERKP